MIDGWMCHCACWIIMYIKIVMESKWWYSGLVALHCRKIASFTVIDRSSMVLLICRKINRRRIVKIHFFLVHFDVFVVIYTAGLQYGWGDSTNKLLIAELINGTVIIIQFHLLEFLSFLDFCLAAWKACCFCFFWASLSAWVGGVHNHYDLWIMMMLNCSVCVCVLWGEYEVRTFDILALDLALGDFSSSSASLSNSFSLASTFFSK